MTAQPFRETALDYLEAGFGPLQLPPRKKETPPTGFTGWTGKPITAETVADWLVHKPAESNIAIRLDGDLIGIDVDDYDAKQGGEVWQAAIDAHGAPPPTWITTAREHPSGIRLYRWPELVTKDNRPSDRFHGIEALHRGHRYAMVWPSWNPKAGAQYRWITPAGADADGEIPNRSDIPLLPDEWVEHFRQECRCFRKAPVVTFDWGRYRGDGAEGPIRKVLDEFRRDFAGGRHDATTRAVAAVHTLQQWPGADDARREIESTFLNSVTGDRSRSQREAELELRRMWEGAEDKFDPIHFEDRGPSPAPPAPERGGNSKTLRELLGKTIEPTRWAIDGLLPEGLTVIGGAPKVGKSFLAVQICLSVASGSPALGKFETTVSDVLYVAYEDGDRRLQERFRQLGSDRLTDAQTERIHLDGADWPTIDAGGTEHLDRWLSEHPECRLVILDTFQRFRGAATAGRNQYAEDYAQGAQIQAVALRHRVAIVLLHHVRQMPAEDWMDRIAGTSGITGAADTVIAIFRDRGQHDAVMHGTGRDIEDFEYAIKRNPDASWSYLGDPEVYRLSRERVEILEAMQSLGAHLGNPVGVSIIAEEVGKSVPNVSKMLRKLLGENKVITPKHGQYALQVSVYPGETVETVETNSTESTTSTTRHTEGAGLQELLGGAA